MPSTQAPIENGTAGSTLTARDSFSEFDELLGHVKSPVDYPNIGLIYSSGYKFETLSVLPDPWHPTPREYIENREEMVVNNYAQYCSVVKTGIGQAKMIIGGEVDASELIPIAMTL